MDCLFGLQGRGPGVCSGSINGLFVWFTGMEYVEMGALNGLFVWFAGKRPRSM